jgi:hypothetical protein
MEKKQTAMQFLMEQLNKNLPSFSDVYKEEFEQALRMEREQIEEAYWDGGHDMPMTEQSCKEYYTQTYV